MATSERQIDPDSAHILRLPVEIMEQILLQKIIKQDDIGRISQVSHAFKDLCSSNELWRHKIMQRWSHLLDRYDRDKTYNWREEYKKRHIYGKRIREMVNGLSPLYYSWEEISKEGFVEFGNLMSEHPTAGEFMLDELVEIVHGGNKHENLTNRYYAEKVLRYLQQKHLSQKIQVFLKLSSEKQTLEKGAVLIAEWCQPTENITENNISDQLDEIAADVKALISQRFPKHPLLSTEQTDISTYLSEDCWSSDHCRAVLNSLNAVFFDKYKFCGNKKDYYNPANSYINQVLKKRTGIPISLCVVYSSIARRLGVICEPVNFPSHFLLRWKEHPMQTPDKMYTYIDVFNAGKLIAVEDLSKETNIPQSLISLENITVNRASQVFERMARNLVTIGRQQGRMGDSLLDLRNALELSLLISPDDIDTRMLQVRVNLHLNINLPDVIDSLQTIADYDQNRMGLVAYLMNAAQTQMQENKDTDIAKPIKAKPRQNKKTVKFSVGLVMRHKRYNYRCVIYGWDTTCQASQEWIVQMGVNNLPHKDKQPFYNVLVDDGTNRYAAEENLEFPDTQDTVSHPEIGRYFREYHGNCYVPNNEKQTEYPDDLSMTFRLVQENTAS